MKVESKTVWEEEGSRRPRAGRATRGSMGSKYNIYKYRHVRMNPITAPLLIEAH